MLVDQRPEYRKLTQQDYESMAGPDWPSYEEFSQNKKIHKFIAQELDSMIGQVDQLKHQISNFCVLPFYGREYPGNVFCCLIPKDANINKIRKDMLANIRTDACNACWILEDSGVTSDRQIKNSTIDFYTDKDITQWYLQALDNNFHVNQYKISASNFCNSTCVTCDSDSSSSWEKLLDPNKKIIPINYDAESKLIQIDYETAKFIHFVGGESTMIRTHWDILEKLIEVGNTDCVVSFVTNGSFNFTDRQKDLLKKFKDVIFCFSVDGVGPVYEYMRYPLSWEKLCENIKWARDQNYKVTVSYTISNLNIFYHEQTINWFDEMKLSYLNNPVYDPEIFSPYSLSKPIKDAILNRTTNSLVQTFMSKHDAKDDKNFDKCLFEIQKQDRLKQISIQDYLPEVAKLIGQP